MVAEVSWAPRYKVSSDGTVIGTRGKPIGLRPDDTGYARVYINGKGVRVHRLVASAFIEKPEGCDVVNHIDGNKMNNAVENLEWVTQTENCHHAYVNGLSPKLGKGEDGLRSILRQVDVDYIRKNCVKRDPANSMTALARMFGVSVSCIHLAYHGRSWA